jgi:hypothetical protein
MRNVLILIIIFVISVLVRVPNLNRPISKHHEFNTAFFLIPMEIWQQEGIAKHGFIPPYNYTNANDKFIAEPIGVEEGNKNGTYYYLSFPSLSYIAPYALFSLFNMAPTALSLQVFNLMLHLVVCLLLYGVFSKVFSTYSALLGVMFYMFSAGTLWFHGNAYTHHIFAIFLVVISLHFLTKIVFENKLSKVNGLMFVFSLIFLFLTEWISVFLAFILVVFSIVYFKKNPAYKKLILLTLLAGVLSALLLFAQYSYYFGWQEYLDYQFNRFSYRSTLVNDSLSIGEQIFSWLKWTVVSFGAWMLLIAVFLLLVLVKNKNDWKITQNEKLLLALLFFPAFLYHVVFMEFTVVHDYSVIIDGLFWSFLLAFLAQRIKLSATKINIFACVVIVLSVAQYYAINRPGKYNQNGDLYSIYKDIGETIKATSTSDDTIFITGFDYSVNQNNPQIIYYAKRNFKPVNNELDAQTFMQEFNRQSAKLYILDKGKVVQIKSLTLSDTF